MVIVFPLVMEIHKGSLCWIITLQIGDVKYLVLQKNKEIKDKRICELQHELTKARVITTDSSQHKGWHIVMKCCR